VHVAALASPAAIVEIDAFAPEEAPILLPRHARADRPAANLDPVAGDGAQASIPSAADRIARKMF
jgi:hypothetical protein